MSYLSSSRYGKDNVRLLKVKKDPQDPNKQDVMELTVTCLLEGEVDVSYTKADNSPIVPTDTVKNTTFILAKQTDTWPIERFAATLANHFVTKYPHIKGAFVDVVQHRWTRYNVKGQPHPHSFLKDGEETRRVHFHYNPSQKIFEFKSGLKDLTVLKSTGSMFYDFHQCEYTSLQPTTDRILSTDVTASWKWDVKKISTIEDIYKAADAGVFDTTFDTARNITLELFALENSPSVQATMYNMSTRIIDEAPYVSDVSYTLPNKHYVAIDMAWHKGLKNTGKDTEVLLPLANPNGLIDCTVTRESKSKL